MVKNVGIDNNYVNIGLVFKAYQVPLRLHAESQSATANNPDVASCDSELHRKLIAKRVPSVRFGLKDKRRNVIVQAWPEHLQISLLYQ